MVSPPAVTTNVLNVGNHVRLAAKNGDGRRRRAIQRYGDRVGSRQSAVIHQVDARAAIHGVRAEAGNKGIVAAITS